MDFESNRFDDSTSIFNSDGPLTLYERLGYAKQLVFSRTKLEFRLLWNKVFQKEDEELGWLLSPYRSSGNSTMMSQLGKNTADQDPDYQPATTSYQYNYHDIASSFDHEKVTIHNRSVTKKRNGRKRNEKPKTLAESAMEIARYMGMGVYMTSTSFPSPFLPINDLNLYNPENFEGYYYERNSYAMSKLW